MSCTLAPRKVRPVSRRSGASPLTRRLPLVHAAVSANTFAIYGTGHLKELTELVPGILNQLGPDSLASLRKLAESYQSLQQGQQRPNAAAEDDDDEQQLFVFFLATAAEEETGFGGDDLGFVVVFVVDEWGGAAATTQAC